MTLLVGPDKVAFTVHKDLVCAASRYFNSMLNRDDGEHQTELLPLEKRIEVFDDFVHWLYHDVENESQPYLTGSTQIRHYLDLYVFADRYEVLELKNEILDQLVTTPEIGGTTRLFSETEAYWIYRRLPRGSGLRKLLADVWIDADNRQETRRLMTKNWMSANPELTADLLNSMNRELGRLDYLRVPVGSRDPRTYHDSS